MKNLNIPLEDERHDDLAIIQDYYSKESGTKLSKAQTIKRLLFESAKMILNTGRIREEITQDENK